MEVAFKDASISNLENAGGCSLTPSMAGRDGADEYIHFMHFCKAMVRGGGGGRKCRCGVHIVICTPEWVRVQGSHGN